MNFEQDHKEWKAANFAWLPNTQEIPKTLGERVKVNDGRKIEVRYISK